VGDFENPHRQKGRPHKKIIYPPGVGEVNKMKGGGGLVHTNLLERQKINIVCAD
jgi:hypothetical protein